MIITVPGFQNVLERRISCTSMAWLGLFQLLSSTFSILSMSCCQFKETNTNDCFSLSWKSRNQNIIQFSLLLSLYLFTHIFLNLFNLFLILNFIVNQKYQKRLIIHWFYWISYFIILRTMKSYLTYIAYQKLYFFDDFINLSLPLFLLLWFLNFFRLLLHYFVRPLNLRVLPLTSQTLH